jgi:hypothetical protein
MKNYYILSAKIHNGGVFTPCWYHGLSKKKAQRQLREIIFKKDKIPITAIKMVILT